MSSEAKRVRGNNSGLGIIVGIYFIIELVINYSLYKQMSVNSNAYAVGSLEMWAKIAIGIGAALFYVQVSAAYNNYTNQKTDNPASIFVLICLLTIPLSFVVQNFIVTTIVDNADQETINNSILVAATKSTAVPYYDYSRGTYDTEKVASGETWKVSYPFSFKEKLVPWVYLEQERAFFGLADNCSQNAQKALNLDRNMDKVFFAFHGIRNPSSINEAEYKGLIKDFYSCIYSDRKFRYKHIKGITTTDVVWKQYQRFGEKSGEYNEFRWKAESRQFRNNKDKMMRELNKEWRKQADKEMGFKTTIGPGLGWHDFIAHPDVKRAFLKKAEKGTLWPYGDEYADFITKTVMDSLPDKILLGYQNQDGSIIDPAEGEVAIDGREVYKSIIMPVVGIGLSAIFLVFNSITLFASMISRVSIIASGIVLIVALAWVVFWPGYHLSKSVNPSPIIQDSGFVFKIIYYHEENLAKLYSYEENLGELGDKLIEKINEL